MPAWKSVAGTTRVHRGGAPKHVHRLLSSVLVPLTAHARIYHDRTDDHAFAYREKQFHSILIPAFRDVAEIVFREQPVQRGREAAGTHGWVDYWLEREKKVTLLELKHGFVNMRTGDLTAAESGRWDEAQDQMQTLAEHAGPALMAAGSRAFVVGLFALVHWCTGDVRDEPHAARNACWSRHKSLIPPLNAGRQYPVTWNALWMVPRHMQFCRWTNTEQTYPAVSFFAASTKSEPAAETEE